MDNFLYENHRGSPTMTLLKVLNVLNVLNMPKDLSLACWALFIYSSYLSLSSSSTALLSGSLFGHPIQCAMFDNSQEPRKRVEMFTDVFPTAHRRFSPSRADDFVGLPPPTGNKGKGGFMFRV